MNTYNILEEENYSTILYHAVAENEEQVRNMAEEEGINLEGLIIELERINVRDELGRPYSPRIEDAIVQ